MAEDTLVAEPPPSYSDAISGNPPPYHNTKPSTPTNSAPPQVGNPPGPPNARRASPLQPRVGNPAPSSVHFVRPSHQPRPHASSAASWSAGRVTWSASHVTPNYSHQGYNSREVSTRVGSDSVKPNNYLKLSVIVTILCFFPGLCGLFGWIAIWYGLKVNSYWKSGSAVLAKEHSNMAYTWNMAHILVGILVTVTVVLLVAVSVGVVIGANSSEE